MAHVRYVCNCSKTVFSKHSVHRPGPGYVEILGSRWISCSKYPTTNKTGYGTGLVARVSASLDRNAEAYMTERNLKPKEHPGIFHLPKISLPEKFVQAVQLILSHENVPQIVEDSNELRNHIWSRHLPVEDELYRATLAKIEKQVRAPDQVLMPFLSEAESTKLNEKRNRQIADRMRKHLYHWEPLRFTKDKALAYLVGKSAGEYAVLYRIFNEIAKRDPGFQPKTMCDYGSGVGTVSWAAREFWSKTLHEHLCADLSWEMNELAERILRGGNQNNDHQIPALFFRQHLPESYKIGYDLVVSAFSLMECSSTKARLETIDKLWKKTEEYLVIVEPGTKAGFRIIMEARDYILGFAKSSHKEKGCYVFSPCPSSDACPRFSFDTIPCNFELKYRPLYPFHYDGCARDRFCYVVIRRGKRPDTDEQWPRLVQDPKVRHKHVVCRVCTKNADISEVVLTKAKHSQSFRLIAKRSDWGDLLPIDIDEYKRSRSHDAFREELEESQDNLQERT